MFGTMLIIIIILVGAGIIYSILKQKINELNETNNEIENAIKNKTKVEEELASLEKLLNDFKEECAVAERNVLTAQTTVDKILYQETLLKETIKTLKENKEACASNWISIIEKKYEETEEEYEKNIENLKQAYEDIQDELIEEREEAQLEINKLIDTRAAAIRAYAREITIEENAEDFKIELSAAELNDIKTLEHIKPQLSQPRVLSMLIWSTYYQKPMNSLCSKRGANVTGIYKITNLTTKECYIGQAVDVGTRWKTHAKCGLGIDTPATNKLYKAMLKFGVHNFSWEILEECSREELNEKEKTFIEIYQSKYCGYNSTRGNDTV